MQGIKDYIIEVKDPFKDTIEVGSVQLFVDKKISRDRASNRFGTIVNIPVFGDNTVLKIGDEIIFDATILYQQIFKEGTQDSIHLVNKEKSWYKIPSELIILHRENNSKEWKGHQDNLMVSFIKEDPKTFSGILTGPATEKFVKGKAIIKYSNDYLEAQGVTNGQEVFINASCGIPFFFKDETVYWVRSKDILAV